MLALDLFAGCGGWDVACQALGIGVDGVENMPAAVETRTAAGLRTVHDDVWTYDLSTSPAYDGLIASPPCQTFSMAGKGSGREALDAVLQLVDGHEWKDLDKLRAAVDEHGWDERTGLVLVPLSHWWALRPEWVCLEQVPAVLPVWAAVAGVMRQHGYSAWAGYLTSETFGVPQTRKRAVLIASRTRDVGPPPPTHSRYYPRDKSHLDEGVLPWVSMAQALGWGLPHKPSPTIIAGTADGGAQPVAHWAERVVSDPSFVTPGVEYVNGTHERAARRATDEPAPSVMFGARLNTVEWRMRSNYGTGGDPAARGERASDEPAPTVTGKIDRNKWQGPGGVDPDGPATTVAGDPRLTSRSHHFPGEQGKGAVGSDVVREAWQMATAGATARYTAGQVPRDPEEPSATMTGKGTAYWTPAEQEQQHSAKTSVRVSVEEAACLQSFPPGFPFRGTKTKKYLQIGNAIPPRLALAVLREAIG